MQTILIAQPSPAPTLILPCVNATYQIHPSEIIRIEAMSAYSKLYFTNGKTLVVAKVLKWFAAELPEPAFIRTHRTHLVNTAFISHYLRLPKSTVALTNGERIEVSRRKKASFLNRWQAAA